MHKKLITACMAIAAFAAFVIAPAASASPALTETTTGGPLVAVGSSIKGTNTGETKFTIVKGGSAVVCTHAEMKGTLTGNSGTKIKGEIPSGGATFKGTASGEDCTSSLGAIKPTLTSKLCLETNTGADTVKVDGCGANITFSLDVTNVTTCKYKAASVSGTFITSADATVNVSEQPAVLAESNFLCPSEGWLDMDFDLTTTDGTTLYIS